ncbi:MAG: DNA helicase RecQ [Oscillibacter sp.]|jgi:ATP-dependent DNA helicase RecQ|nr:DNA helicase RecQ [Oscillibacter sp.]MCI8688693.1 DNA helicase RecQ [Oscillibacter sp.]
MDKYTVLKQSFGHTAFRPGQETLVDGILSGRDVLGIMPTGGGKSLCYQIPALLLPGITVVISPLISLMKDQVAALHNAGISAAFLNSALDQDAARQVWEGIRWNVYKLLYIAPERLEDPRFLDVLGEVSLVAVDEAHCISQWGQDFRPSYLKIAEFVAQLPTRPILAAFTATATAQVQEDIAQCLALREPVQVVTGFDRPNLFFDVQRPKQKLPAVLELVKERRGRSGIVYCATRSAVEKVCGALCAEGIPATRYHAGLSEKERLRSQDDFQFDRKPVMVATNAFGMGIDKSNVSFVIHYNMPKNLESYYQEAGRAGRDGEPADCILLYGPGDVSTAKFLISHSDDGALSEEERAALQKQNLDLLNVMTGYCKTTGCLRGYILEYFGQAHPKTCNGCGNCGGTFESMDITIPAQIILSCVKRVQKHLGYFVGMGMITQVLRAGKGQRVLDLRLDTLSTYGLLKETPAPLLRRYFECLETGGYTFIEPEHSTLRLTERAGAVLFRGERVTMQVKAERQTPDTPRKVPAPGIVSVNADLLAALKATRNRLAQEEAVPAYIVFSNATLSDMAAKEPRSMKDFLEVSGVGRVKASRYGEAFLETIRQFFAAQL